MASTTRQFDVSSNISEVWDFVSDMGNWAAQMPGYVAHEILDANTSVWTINIEMGPVQRPIDVDVYVSNWDEPGAVSFAVKGKHEPFSGGGAYRAESLQAGTRITLDFHAEPSGSMARIISPLVGPVLERIADEFSGNLGRVLGRVGDPAHAIARRPSFLSRLWHRMRELFGFGRA